MYPNLSSNPSIIEKLEKSADGTHVRLIKEKNEPQVHEVTPVIKKITIITKTTDYLISVETLELLLHTLEPTNIPRPYGLQSVWLLSSGQSLMT